MTPVEGFPPLEPTSPELPEALTVEGFKKRLGKELDADDDLLSIYLTAAWEDAQGPAPQGTGRNLVPEPAALDDDPVLRTLKVVRRRALIPDAAAITSITAFSGVEGSTGQLFDPDAVELVERNGHFIQLELPFARSFLGRYEPYAYVDVLGHFGFYTLPTNLIEGIYALAALKYLERDGSYRDSVNEQYGESTRDLRRRVGLSFGAFNLPAAYAGL